MFRPLRAAALVLIACLLALQSACGGGSSSSAATGTFSITLSPISASVTVGSTRLFSATARNNQSGAVLSGVNFSWQSSNPAIAASLGNGMFRGIAPGSVSITASASLQSPGQTAQSVTSTPATLSVISAVEGTAARGAALVGASVSLRDAHGQYAAGVSDAEGHFLLRVDGLTGPFLLEVESQDGRHFYGWSAAAGDANLDPYTDLLVRAWYQSAGADVEAAFAGRGPLPDPARMAELDAGLTQLLAGELAARGLDPRHFSLLATPFSADHSGFDALLDSSHVTAGRIELPGWSAELRLDAAGHADWQAQGN